MPLIVYPHAFVNEHIETLVEIEIEYKEKALSLGVPSFKRVETVGEGEHFIAGLTELVYNVQDGSLIGSCDIKRLCPKSFLRCPNKSD